MPTIHWNKDSDNAPDPPRSGRRLLSARYGNNRKAIAAAVRAEAPGGAELLDALGLVATGTKWGDNAAPAAAALRRAAELAAGSTDATEGPAVADLAPSLAAAAVLADFSEIFSGSAPAAAAYPVSRTLLEDLRDRYYAAVRAHYQALAELPS